jgi:hypothetical protein
VKDKVWGHVHRPSTHHNREHLPFYFSRATTTSHNKVIATILKMQVFIVLFILLYLLPPL